MKVAVSACLLGENCKYSGGSNRCERLLQSRSPSCGVHEVYDGTFTGTLVSGRGLFAQALAAASVMLVDASEV